MKQVTQVLDLYTFDELDEDAQARAINDERDEQLETGILTDVITEQFEISIDSAFPNSDLKVEWSLSYSQGDGVNIYGTLSLEDALDNVQHQFTDQELKVLKEYIVGSGYTVKLPYNQRYTYCMTRWDDISDALYDDLETDGFEDINESLVEKFGHATQDYICDMCKKFENDGYAILEDDAYIIDTIVSNDWYFYKDGRFYGVIDDENN